MERPGAFGEGGATGLWLEWEQAGKSKRLPLDRPLTIGRDEASDICLTGATVSRNHAVVGFVSGGPYIDASASVNGLTLNGGRLDKLPLTPGQSFKIGEASFRVVQGPATGQTPPPTPMPMAARSPKGYGSNRQSTPSRSRVPFLIAAAAVVTLAVAGVGYFVNPITICCAPPSLHNSAFAAASLDPSAPDFPVPAGSTLINAQTEGSGAAAYRLASWQSSKDYDATVAFYTTLQDSRWHASRSPVTTPLATDISFSDSSSVFASAEVEVARTDPVRIDVRFLPKSSPPAQSFAPGPTIAFGPLPTASALPDGFPAELVPAGSKLVDAGAIGTTYFATFSGNVDVAAYQAQIGKLVQISGTHTQSGSTVIDFTLNGKPGQAVIDPAAGQTSVEVTK